jgi:dihydrolipoamide dehydrogenase
MAEHKSKTQVAVIGGGPGGYAAAFMAADLGLDVTLINPEANPGGVCLYRGCIPSKALLHVARLLGEAQEAEHWGITFGQPKIDLDRLRAWKEEVVEQLTSGLGQLARQRKITYLKATASFKDNETLQIDHVDGGRDSLTFESAIVATGSRPSSIPALDIGSERVMDSTAALKLKEVPKSLLVIGGGYIGLEMATVYARLGAKVTIVEMTPDLLPGVDSDLVSVLAKQLERQTDQILLNTIVREMKEQKNGVKVTMETKAGEDATRVFDRVLVAVGRRPNSNDIGLENTRIETDDRGFVRVDRQRRTAEANIYAIGDVAGEPMLAHKASHEGRLAAEVIAGKKVVWEPQAIPAVVFTDPEIAWCGLTGNDAKNRGIDVETARFPWMASGRAKTLGRTDGVTKLLVDPRTKRILGMGVAGPGAGELIAEGVLAVEMGAVASDLGLSIHPHPTLSETVMEAADLIYGHATHYHRPKRR